VQGDDVGDDGGDVVPRPGVKSQVDQAVGGCAARMEPKSGRDRAVVEAGTQSNASAVMACDRTGGAAYGSAQATALSGAKRRSSRSIGKISIQLNIAAMGCTSASGIDAANTTHGASDRMT
jgi:hypothetical protein